MSGRPVPLTSSLLWSFRWAARRAAGWTACLAAAWLLSACGRASPDPHVVLISVDTLRADHVGLYGYERDTTPNLDRFFGDGTTFRNATSTSPCTIPAVRQLLSGGFDLEPSRQTLAELLRARGYATGAVVSQHQFTHRTEQDYARGFDSFDMQAPDEVDHHAMTTRTAEDVSDRGLAWLESHASDDPVFLWLHYFDPHDPYEPPAVYRSFDAGNRSTRSGDRRRDLMAERKAGEPWVQAGHIFTPDDVAHLVALYDSEILYTDAQISRVLDALEKRGWLEHSVVALVSDHGEWLGENGLWDHCLTLREPEIRTPFLLRVRGAPLGRERQDPRAVSNLDLVPTLAGIVGLELPPGIYSGADLRTAPADRTVFAFWDPWITVRDASWKLLESGGGDAGLFRFPLDPKEERNLLQARDDVAERLEKELDAVRPLAERLASEGRDVIEQLKSIGYVE